MTVKKQFFVIEQDHFSDQMLRYIVQYVNVIKS